MYRKFLAGLTGLLLPLPLLAAQAPGTPVPVAPGQAATITITPYTAPSPTVDFTLYNRHGHVYPHHVGCSHTGSGYIDIQQPTTDTIVITMTGIAVALGSPCSPGVAGLDFDLEQCFEVVYEGKDVKAAKMTVDARVIGLLRSECKGGGSAEESNGCVTIVAGPAQVLTLCAPSHSVAGGENLSINDHEGPISVPVSAGKYTLHQCFHIAATMPKSFLPCRAPSAEFAPDPALDPLWISYWEPFHGVAKKDFGFQVTIKVAEDTNPPAADAAPAAAPGPMPGEPGKEPVPAPKPDVKPEAKPVSRLRLF
jgi:hypothetical protein